MLNICWHFYFLRRLSEQLGHRLHHCAFRFDGVMWRRISLHLLFCLITFGSWNCFCSFWSADDLIIVICTIKFRLLQMLFCIYSANFSYSDDSNDFSLNVVKYGLWSMEWDSWYLNSVCWFSFFPSRVFYWGVTSLLRAEERQNMRTCPVLLLEGFFCLVSGVPSWRSLRRKVYTSHALFWFHFRFI